MNQCLDITARHWQTGEGVRLQCQAGRCLALEPTAKPAAEWPWLAPALLDPQINGFAGVDFQSDHLDAEALIHAARALQAAGCARFLPTLITEEWSTLLRRLTRLRELRSPSPLLSAAVAGWHLEGPFLSPEAGFHGAHDPRLMLNPTQQHIRELRKTAGEDLVLLTLAPERPGAIEAIQEATRLGMRVSLGHTNASAEVLRAAVAAGATGFTHLGNGCPQALDRHDNVLWRALDQLPLTCGLIADGRHVSPALFRLCHRLRPGPFLYHTTDAMAAAGVPPGRYPLGRLTLEVGADRIVRQPGQTNFAGSALRPIEGVLRAAAMRGVSWRETWPYFSVHAAQWLGLPPDLELGSPPRFCLVTTGPDETIRQVRLHTLEEGWQEVDCRDGFTAPPHD